MFSYSEIEELSEIIEEQLGTKGFLDALLRAMSYDQREDLFRYIIREYEVVTEFEEEDDEEDY